MPPGVLPVNYMQCVNKLGADRKNHKISKNHKQGILWPKLTNGGMHLVVMCASPNYCPNLSATDIRAKNPI